MTPEEERAQAVALADLSRTRIRAVYDFLIGETMQGVDATLAGLAAGLSTAPGAEPAVKAALDAIAAAHAAGAQAVREQIVALDSFIDPPEPAPDQ